MKKIKGLILLSILLFLAWCIYSVLNGGIIYAVLTNNETAIESTIEQAGILAPIVFILIVLIEVIIAPIPGGPLYFTAGILFPPLLGATLVLIGNIVGAYLAFTIAKMYGREIIARFLTERDLRLLDKFSKEKGSLTLFLLRINPLTSTDFFSYLAGTTQISKKKFMIATTLGLTPLILAEAYIGRIIASSPITYTIFLSLSAVYLIVALAIIIKIKR